MANLMMFPGWDSLDSVRATHSWLEAGGITFFALLVIAEVISHRSKKADIKHRADLIGIWFFAIAVACEIAGFGYGQRNDELSGKIIQDLGAIAKEASGEADVARRVSAAAKITADAADLTSKGANGEAAAAAKASGSALNIASGARREADSFEKDIVSAKTQAAEAESSLAGALKQAADAKDEALRDTQEIVRLKTPRSLNGKQQENISGKIRGFQSVPYDLWVSTDSDSAALMEAIDQALLSAGWKFNLPDNPILYNNKAGVIAASGVSIHCPVEHPEWQMANAILRDALLAEGISAVAYSDTAEGERGMKRDRIHVEIGSKPLN